MTKQLRQSFIRLRTKAGRVNTNWQTPDSKIVLGKLKLPMDGNGGRKAVRSRSHARCVSPWSCRGWGREPGASGPGLRTAGPTGEPGEGSGPPLPTIAGR